MDYLFKVDEYLRYIMFKKFKVNIFKELNLFLKEDFKKVIIKYYKDKGVIVNII